MTQKSLKEFVESQEAFYGVGPLYACPRCNRGVFNGSMGQSRCNDCCGAGVLKENGDRVDE